MSIIKSGIVFGMVFGVFGGAAGFIHSTIGEVVHVATGAKIAKKYMKKGERDTLLSIGVGFGVAICSIAVGLIIDWVEVGNGLFGL